MNLDTRIFLDINDFARNTPWLHPIMSGYANYGVALFAILLLAGWWVALRQVSREKMVAAVWAPLGALAALAINQPISGAVNETRPCNALHDIVVLHCNTDGSFPSDHAMMAGAVAAGLWLVDRRLSVLATVAALLMAFTRVYIAAHYPQDVLAGLVLGAVVSLAGFWLARPALRWLLTQLTHTPLRILITAQSTAAQENSR
ncbi:phosphatase PAP2 family protein [Nocardia sp. alder85J]|uniref:phosphatase PAP2 family protein n=1 Tax=Nocardia sp. alder85J TaxID=2862949 RepID=UPI001CD20354|nr:phosphatase PAP2 family protein [Nocardia sp. alder85J]MCX4091957.1 phosphatase PAP2 family protein [Nocardia sp. alder85J]